MKHPQFGNVSMRLFLCVSTLSLAWVPVPSHAVESVISLAPAIYTLVSRDKAERRFGRHASNTYAAGYEAIDQNGISIGIQATSFSLDYSTGIARYSADVSMVSAVARQYFNLPGQFRPYYGIGAGLVYVETDEPKGYWDDKTFSGDTYYLGVGFLYNWNHIGLGLDYSNNFTRVGDGHDDISLSGWGLAAGIKLLFGK